MMPPDYATAIACLQENLAILTDGFGNVRQEDRPIWNLSNALLVVLDALQQLDQRLSQ